MKRYYYLSELLLYPLKRLQSTLNILTFLLHHLFLLLSHTPQRKELGVVVYNCSCLALDLHRVFSFYWQLHERDYIPSIWSKRVTALYGKNNALQLQLNSTPATAYVSVSYSFVMLQDLVPT